MAGGTAPVGDGAARVGRDPRRTAGGRRRRRVASAGTGQGGGREARERGVAAEDDLPRVQEAVRSRGVARARVHVPGSCSCSTSKRPVRGAAPSPCLRRQPRPRPHSRASCAVRGRWQSAQRTVGRSCAGCPSGDRPGRGDGSGAGTAIRPVWQRRPPGAVGGRCHTGAARPSPRSRGGGSSCRRTAVATGSVPGGPRRGGRSPPSAPDAPSAAATRPPHPRCPAGTAR